MTTWLTDIERLAREVVARLKDLSAAESARNHGDILRAISRLNEAKDLLDEQVTYHRLLALIEVVKAAEQIREEYGDVVNSATCGCGVCSAMRALRALRETP